MFPNCINKFAFSTEKSAPTRTRYPSHIQKRNRQRALSVDTNCSGIAPAAGAGAI